MSELTTLTLAEARDGLKQKKFSAAELAHAHLAAMEKARAIVEFQKLEMAQKEGALGLLSISRGDGGNSSKGNNTDGIATVQVHRRIPFRVGWCAHSNRAP